MVDDEVSRPAEARAEDPGSQDEADYGDEGEEAGDGGFQAAHAGGARETDSYYHGLFINLAGWTQVCGRRTGDKIAGVLGLRMGEDE